MDQRFVRWTPREDDILFERKAARVPNRKIAHELDRTIAAVGERYHRLVEKRGYAAVPLRVRAAAWTDADDETLYDMKIGGHRDRVIATRLGRTDEAISARWKKVRTKKGMGPLRRSHKRDAVKRAAIVAQAPPSVMPSRAVRHSTLIMDAELRARIAIQGPNGLLGDPLPGRSALDRRVIEDPRSIHASRLNPSYSIQPGAGGHLAPPASVFPLAPAGNADASPSELVP